MCHHPRVWHAQHERRVMERLSVSSKTPKDIVAKLHYVAAAALASADVKKRLADLGVEVGSSSPEVLGELLKAEIKRWGDVITRANIPKQ